MPNGQNYRQQRINYALAATLLTQGVAFADIVPQVGAKNVESLRVGLARKGVTLRTTKTIPPTVLGVTGYNAAVAVRVAAQASTIIAESGRKLRQSLATASEASAALLESKPAKSVSAVILRASALKSLVDAGDKLHGWSAQASAPAWNVTILDRSLPSVVEPSVVEAPALDVVEVPTCVSDTPTGSVPESSPIA